MPTTKKTTLERPLHAMPEFIASALGDHGVRQAYDERPPYQRNDYIGWITSAKRQATKEKRLAQMLSELKGAKLYMNMPYMPKSGKK